MLNKRWRRIIKNIDYAFQPIINPRTGRTFAFEALLRGIEEFNFLSISSFFDSVFENNYADEIMTELRKKLIQKFSRIPFYNEVKLFYNYDYRSRLFDEESFKTFEDLFSEYKIMPDMFCLEISEKNKVESINDFKDFLSNAKDKRFNIALDDFGAGYAGLEIFYYSDPNFLKFDRFLIEGIDSDIKKKSFCSHILNLTKLMGIFSIAEGIETEKEYNTCKEIGFELIQGYFIQKPTVEIKELSLINKKILELHLANKRKAKYNDIELISREVIKLDAVKISDKLTALIGKFQKQCDYTFFPVIDALNFPLGIIHEKNLKPFIYSPYGQDILKHKNIVGSMENIITRCPVLDINTKQEKILEVFVNNPETEGVIIVEDNKYIGFLTAKSLLNIVNEKNLKEARELNPLTKLPGNILINRYLSKVHKKRKSFFYLIYFDFDFFKPFNDKFGFRQGDRAIILFTEMLKKRFSSKNFFIGHIGGDDFFLGIEYDKMQMERVHKKIKLFLEKFSQTVSLFYSKDELESKSYLSKNRNGEVCFFPLLSATAAIIEIPSGKRRLSNEQLVFKLAELKKEAKITGVKIFYYSLDENLASKY